MLLVREPLSNQARSLVRFWRASGIDLIAPDFMATEVASAFRKKISDGILTVDDAKSLTAQFYRLNIDFRPARTLHERAIDLAVELNQRLAYDAHYLALAESLGGEFWTGDRPFFRAASGQYPSVKWIGNYHS